MDSAITAAARELTVGDPLGVLSGSTGENLGGMTVSVGVASFLRDGRVRSLIE